LANDITTNIACSGCRQQSGPSSKAAITAYPEAVDRELLSESTGYKRSSRDA
jgi:hypothetical protein